MKKHTTTSQKTWLSKATLLALTLTLTLSFAPKGTKAQQEAQYSQFMFNQLFINPAYAGSRDQASMSLIGRNQWTGFPGAPQSGAFALHGPSANMKNGFGIVESLHHIF